MKFEVSLNSPSGKRTCVVDLERVADRWRVSLDGQPVEADAVEIAPNILSILLRGESHEIRIARQADSKLNIQTGPREFTAEVTDPRSWRGRRLAHVEVEGRQQITAPMAGKVVRVLVKAGDQVEAAQGLLVVEAMKMQNEIRSPKSGTVERLLAKEGQPVNAGEILAWIS
jgi:biotin carboxyl carrier protein